MKQLVFDSESLILPEHIKMQNGFLNGSIVATTNADTTVTSSNGSTEMEDVKPNVSNLNDATAALGSSQQIMLDNDHFVTLHIDEDENMIVNELDAFNQNDEISKLFKQVNSQRFTCVITIRTD